MLIQIYFWCLAAILIGAAIGVITSRNPVFSVLYLVLAFVTSAVLWMLLEAEFLAIVLVLVYVGAVMVLFLFVVMMLDIHTEELRKGFTRFAPLGGVVAAVMVVELVTVFLVRNTGLPVLKNPPPHPAGYSNTKELGAVLYTEHVYAFELASFLLLLAIIAAIVLTMRKRPGLKVQDISAQVRVRREDRVRLVSMEAEKD
jgi:NADH-quinone oxidoreductase subunit J